MPRAKKNPKRPADLPQKPLVWHLTTRQLHTWIAEEGEMATRPYVTLITIPESKAILKHEVAPQALQAPALQTLLIETMLKPEKSSRQKPHRPKQIVVEEESLAQALAPAMQEIDVEIIHQPPLAEVEELISLLEGYMGDEALQNPGLLSVEGVTPELVGRVFAAARDYFQAAPWERLADIQPLAAHFSPPGSQAYIQLMGNAGVQFGLLLYQHWEDVLNSYRQTDNPLDQIPPGGWHSFTYESAEMVPPDDLDAIEQYGWPVAGPNAYPVPGTYTDEEFERPNAQELVIYEALLRAIPPFVGGLLPDKDLDYQPAEATLEVDTFDGPLTVTLRYPAGEIPEELLADWDFDEDLLLDIVDELDEDEDDFEEEEDLTEDLLFDRRSMEATLSSISELIGDHGDSDPALQEAQSLIYQAWDEHKPQKRIRLARQALKISPNCADAYVLLAEEEAETIEEAYKYYLKGKQAGERALGEDYFQENEGHFWGILETRPYMRARQGLAACLAVMGRLDEAIAHYREMLRLNPGDNQGIRYALLTQLVAAKADDEAWQLLDEYPGDDMAAWAYTRALLAFRKKGDSPQAIAALRRAIRQNPHVPALLLGDKPMPETPPEYTIFGDESEAVAYVYEDFNNWWKTRGAIAWLRAQQGSAPPPKKKKRGRRGSKRS